ncbi:MAG: hypothetical protein CMK09_03010 [Ponticaulis sp.]|nr:hypothetical protein [Ponticaulis sp.]|tara:strand:+ start:22408 stop:23166 length:759 start_codon:yes stop_codon:yes gene_type:complete
MHKFIIAGLSGLLLAGCQTDKMTADDTSDVSVLAPTLTGEACPDMSGGGYLFWLDPPSKEVGDKLQLTPYFSTHPGAFEPLPSGCIGNMSSTPEDALTFERSEYGDVYAIITEKAEPGSRVILTADYGAENSITAPISIYDPASNPLVGVWAQQNDGQCADNTVIRELSFSGDGRFSVTWTPFESYKDYWGSYDFDSETNELTLSPERGNYIPEDVQSGVIQLEGDLLTPEDGMSFGSTRNGLACSAPFKRR